MTLQQFETSWLWEQDQIENTNSKSFQILQKMELEAYNRNLSSTDV